MKPRLALAALLLSLLALPAARAQLTYGTITGTVTDPNGNPYANALLTARFVDSRGFPLGGGTTPNGQPYAANVVQTTLDATGHFSVPLVENSIIVKPAGTQWAINISAPTDPAIYTHVPPWTINYTFSVAGSADISSQLSALAQPVAFFNVKTGQSTLSATTWNGGNVSGAAHFLAGISGNLTGNVTGTASGNLPLTGGTLSGSLGVVATNPPAALVTQGSFFPVHPELNLWQGINVTPPAAFWAEFQRITYNTSTAWGSNMGNSVNGHAQGWLQHGYTENYVNNAEGQFTFARNITQAGVGDNAVYDYFYSYGEGVDGGSEGWHINAWHGGEPDVTYAGTVTSGGTGSQQIKTTCTADCTTNAQTGGLRDVGAGRDLLDLTGVVATGTVTSHTNPSSSGWTTPESFGVTVATGSIPQSTAVGTLNADCGIPSNATLAGPQTVSVSCTVTVTSGGFATGDKVSFDGAWHETALVTNVSGSGTQTLTLNLRRPYHPAGSRVYANGCFDCFAVFSTTTADGLKFPITVAGSTSATSFITAAFDSGGSPGYNDVTNAPAGATFTIYRGAEVTDIQNQSTLAVDGSFTLEPNSAAWAVGDTVEEEHTSAEKYFAQNHVLTIHNPLAQTPGFGGWGYDNLTLQGQGILGHLPIGPAGFQGGWQSGTLWAVDNSSQSASYYANGKIPPAIMKVKGPFDGLFQSYAAPADPLLSIGCPYNGSNNPDCTQAGVKYTLFELMHHNNGGNYIHLNFEPDTSTFTVDANGVVPTIDLSSGVGANFKVFTMAASDSSTNAASTAFVKSTFAGGGSYAASVATNSGFTAGHCIAAANTTGELSDSGSPCGGSGLATVTATTTSAVTISGSSGYYYNEEGTAAQAVTYTLPTPTAGMQFCASNYYNGSASTTGQLELLVANAGTQSIVYQGAKSSSGYIQSSGAPGDMACVTAVSTTQWAATSQLGVWTLH